MTPPILHIVFGMSAAHDLRKAFAQLGQSDRVIGLIDDLRFGPINPLDPALRAKWVGTELRVGGWTKVGRESAQFWAEACAYEGRRIAWTSCRSALEYAGFLEFVWRLGNGACEIVDLTNVADALTKRHGDVSLPTYINCLSVFPVQRLLETRPWELAEPLRPDMRRAYRAEWERLRAENAPLRVVDVDLVMRSAPISFFDENLLSHVQPRWLKAARIVGNAMVSDDDRPCPYQVGDLFLASRLRALVDMGVIEGKGDLRKIRFSVVRLPAL